jgi:adenine-specific DNA-methyltransferase
MASKYGSNFQPFVNKRDVKDKKDEDLTAEPEMIKAFRDTWELGIHSYLTYLRDRLLLAKELLHESGSVFVQISDENLHHIREIMDEVFGVENFVGIIAFAKTSSFTTNFISSTYDYIIWYAKDKEKGKFNQLWKAKKERTEGGTYNWIELDDGSCRTLTSNEKKGINPLPKNSLRFRADTIVSPGATKSGTIEIEFEGKKYKPSPNSHWKTTENGMYNLINKNRVVSLGKILAYKRYENDFPYMPYSNVWDDTIIGTFTNKIYVVQTGNLAVQRCLLMVTDPGDLVLDITCGSGTTAHVAEQWGRRWITCDTSRVATTLAKQRFMTSVFDFYKLAYPKEGIGSGFEYKKVPHITLKSIANNEPPAEEILYDQPFIDTKKLRVTGPFTVEAVPAPTAKSLEEIENEPPVSDESVARSGETLRQTEWKDELQRTGIRAKGGRSIEFSRVETMPGTRYIHAIGETKEDNPKRVFISFGQEFAPLEQNQVELALEEAQHLKPSCDILVFAAFEFDSEAAKDIDETNWPGITLLKAQMNADLFTDDLKKKRSSNESFWLIGQPDVDVRTIDDGDDRGKAVVEVNGFDYYNPKNGNVESGGKGNIAMWMLDPDYDGRSLFPTQIFFPMAGSKDGWSKLSRNLKAEIDTEALEAFRGTISVPFEAGRRIAVKIIDDRGIESMRIIDYVK